MYVRFGGEGRCRPLAYEEVRTGWDERKNLILSSGDMPDLFFNALDASDVTNNINLFAPLQDLVAEHAPNIQHMFDESPDLLRASTFPDGNVYTLASRQPARPMSIGSMYINQTWLDTLGLDMPTTTDELRDTLLHFLNDDPNGNGQADEVPLTATGFTWLVSGFTLDLMLGSFGAKHSIDSYRALTPEGKVAYVPATDGWRDWISYMHTLYTDGTLNQEITTGGWTLYSIQTLSDPAIVGLLPSWLYVSEVEDVYVPMPSLTGPNGDNTYLANPLAKNQNSFNLVQISESCADKEAAIRLLNEFYDPEMGIQVYYGSIGQAVEKNDDDTYTLMDYEDNLNWTYGLENSAPVYVTPEWEAKINLSEGLQSRLDADAVYAENFDLSTNYPLLILDKVALDEVSIIEVDMTSLFTQKLDQWVVEGGVEDEWDAYIEEMNNLGLPRYLEIYQEAYDNSR